MTSPSHIFTPYLLVSIEIGNVHPVAGPKPNEPVASFAGAGHLSYVLQHKGPGWKAWVSDARLDGEQSLIDCDHRVKSQRIDLKRNSGHRQFNEDNEFQKKKYNMYNSILPAALGHISAF